MLLICFDEPVFSLQKNMFFFSVMGASPARQWLFSLRGSSVLPVPLGFGQPPFLGRRMVGGGAGASKKRRSQQGSREL